VTPWERAPRRKRRTGGRTVATVFFVLCLCGGGCTWLAIRIGVPCFTAPPASMFDPIPPDVDVVGNDAVTGTVGNGRSFPARRLTFRSTNGESSGQLARRVGEDYAGRGWYVGVDANLIVDEGAEPSTAYVEYVEGC